MRALLLLAMAGCGRSNGDCEPVTEHHPRVEEIDEDGDGALDGRTTWTYDADLRLLSVEYDAGADGTVDSRGVNTWEDGVETRSEADQDMDGTPDSVTTWTYDAAGNATLEEADTDGDGDVDRTTTWAWDADGHMLSSEMVVPDRITLIDTWTWTDGVMRTHDEAREVFTNEGIDGELHESWDAAGNPVSASQEDTLEDIDGTLVTGREDTWTYADGRLELYAGESWTIRNEDVVDRSRFEVTYEYDERGDLAVAHQDGNADGTPESETRYTWDDRGNRLSAEDRSVGDDLVTHRVDSTWDDRDNELTRIETQDFTRDGAWDDTRTLVNTWDEDDNLLTQRTERIMDFTPVGGEKTTEVDLLVYTWGRCGTLVTEDRDRGADGSFEYHMEYAD